jgi:hypothetical protein
LSSPVDLCAFVYHGFAEAVCGRRLPRHALLEYPIHRLEPAVPGSSRRVLGKALRLGADVVLLDLDVAVEQDDRKRARGPIIAAMRELGRSRCASRRASTASSGTGAAASPSR